TAWQMLFDYAHAVAGQTVLVHGAAGNVGAYAVQMARHAGLEVFATASSHDLDYVHALGVDTAIDRRRTRLEDVVPAVDIVLDTVGGDTRARFLGRPEAGWHPRFGRLIANADRPCREGGSEGGFFIVDVTTARLNTIAALFVSKKLVPNVGTVLR